MSENKHTAKEQIARCESMSRLQSVISGKWKILIIWYIAVYEVQRFHELQRRLDWHYTSYADKATQRIGSRRLPSPSCLSAGTAKVEYTLTEMGKRFVPILMQMKAWSDENLL